jgi:type VI protein secretion system component VasF
LKLTKTSLVVKLFEQRKNKRFNYTSRHFQEKENEKEHSLESQWNEAKQANKRKSSKFVSLPFLVLFLITVLVILYILGSYEIK